MGAHWKTELRRAGYDPCYVKDDLCLSGPLSMTIQKMDAKGAKLWDGTDCSGARCAKRTLEVPFVFIGYSTAIVAYSVDDIRRYGVYSDGDTNVPHAQDDHGVGVVGMQLILGRPKERLGTTRTGSSTDKNGNRYQNTGRNSGSPVENQRNKD